MKLLMIISILLIVRQGSTYSCPSYIKSIPMALKAHEFIGKFKGQYTLGKCEVEILVCDGFEGTTTNIPMAEIMLVDQYNREIYLPITYPEIESWHLNTKTQVNKRMLNFSLRDRYYEEELGRTEHYQVEILSDWNNLNKIKSIHLGKYSTNNQLNQANGNDSIWAICKK